MSNGKRRYRVTKPGQPHPDSSQRSTGIQGKGVRAVNPRARNISTRGHKPPEPSMAEPLRPGSEVTRGGKKYRIISPGNVGQAAGRGTGKMPAREEAKVQVPPLAASRAGRGGRRRYKVITPGKPEAVRPGRAQKSAEPVSVTERPKPGRVVRGRQAARPTGGPGATPGRPRKSPEAVEAGPLTDIDKVVLVGLDKGPANVKVLTKRTKVTQSKLLPTLKNLTNQGLVESKRIGRITKYRLTLKADEMLHPVTFPMSLFKRKRRRRGRRGRRRKLSQRQKIRRLDYAIASLVIVILLLMVSLFWYLNTNVLSDGTNNDSNQGPDDLQDNLEPVIIWNNEANEINRASGNLRLNFSIYDRGEDPAGLNMNTLKLQYGFASHRNLLEPNISNWTGIIPVVDLHDVHIIIADNWLVYNQQYLFIRVSIWDKADNFESNTFKIFINI
jgi:DNA-binding PadR family transcriptional regulator